MLCLGCPLYAAHLLTAQLWGQLNRVLITTEIVASTGRAEANLHPSHLLHQFFTSPNYHPHFTNEATEAQKVIGRVSIQ
jgi:hypothetical protein